MCSTEVGFAATTLSSSFGLTFAASFSMSMPIWLREKLFQKKFLFEKLKQHDENFNDLGRIYFSEHHYSHAASAFYPSPFKMQLY